MGLWAWILAVLAVALTSMWSAPLLSRWRSELDTAMFWPLSFGLSVGVLTLALAVIGFAALTRPLVVFVLISLLVLSALFGERHRLPALSIRAWRIGLRNGERRAWIGLALLILLGVVLAQATYYPFTGDDEISRYAYFARLIFENEGLTPTVRGYPMLLPLAYATTFFMSGGLPEQAAKLFPVLFATMTVAATYALARRWFGRTAAWVATIVMAATPLYIHWAPVGYVDIPSALYFVLGAYAADVWRERRAVRWALLAGALAGLALWTKQAGLAMLPTLGVIALVTWIAARRTSSRRDAARIVWHGLLMLFVALFTGGWWYLRNAIYDGWINAIPGPGIFYTQLATHDPTQLIPFVGYFADFGYLAAPLYIAGLLGTMFMLRRRAKSIAIGWCLLWCLPYTALWWWFFSYDPRFLLTVLPFYAVLVGGAVDCGLRIADCGSFIPQPPIPNLQLLIANYQSPITIGAILLLAGVGVFQAELGGTIQWLANPTASYAERLTRAKGDLYPIVVYLLGQTEPDARIYSMDGRVTYYLIDRPITVGYPMRPSDLDGYDYLVVGSWAESVYAGLGRPDENFLDELNNAALYEQIYAGPSSGLVIYRVRE